MEEKAEYIWVKVPAYFSQEQVDQIAVVLEDAFKGTNIGAIIMPDGVETMKKEEIIEFFQVMLKGWMNAHAD